MQVTPVNSWCQELSNLWRKKLLWWQYRWCHRTHANEIAARLRDWNITQNRNIDRSTGAFVNRKCL